MLKEITQYMNKNLGKGKSILDEPLMHKSPTPWDPENIEDVPLEASNSEKLPYQLLPAHLGGGDNKKEEIIPNHVIDKITEEVTRRLPITNVEPAQSDMLSFALKEI